MTYTLKDVDEAAALVLVHRPGTIVERGDFDWSLSVRDKDSCVGIILFRPSSDQDYEISSDREQILNALFFLGSQWTDEERNKLLARALSQ